MCKFIYCFELVLAANVGIFTVDGDAHAHVQRIDRNEKRAIAFAIRIEGMREKKGFNFQMVSEDK